MTTVYLARLTEAERAAYRIDAKRVVVLTKVMAAIARESGLAGVKPTA